MRSAFILLILIFLTPLFLQAQEDPQEGELIDTLLTSVDLFSEADPMQITLTFDLKAYQRTRNSGDYIPVHFLYQINDTLEIAKHMRIKARGEFRREYCSFAPFWLNIRKEDANNPDPQEVDRVKIVTHCMGSRAYTGYLMKEYLIYKIYNLLSPVSFRVRLIRMKYVDTGRKNRITESWAFMIEPEQMLAQRFDAMVIRNDELSMFTMEPETLDLIALFQFMIGNPDYSVFGRKNMKILGLPGYGSTGYTPVPYDFDYTGLVNASYAIPGDNLGITSITERYFLGPCRDEAQYARAIQYIEDQKQEIFELINGFPFLEERPKKEMVKYLESYFRLASNQARMLTLFNEYCR